MTLPPIASVSWPKAHRIIRTIYPPVSLFEDIADPADWDLIASAEGKTNPRVREQVGDLSLVPVERRLSGPTASLVMAAFTHASRDRPGRFSDGRFGVWYCGDREEVALAETIHHCERFMHTTAEPATEADYRGLVCGVDTELNDLRRGFAPECLGPNDWSAAQALGHAIRAAGSNGIVYPSVRWPAGEAAALFWPDCVRLPVNQARQFRYHWNGTRVD